MGFSVAILFSKVIFVARQNYLLRIWTLSRKWRPWVPGYTWFLGNLVAITSFLMMLIMQLVKVAKCKIDINRNIVLVHRFFGNHAGIKTMIRNGGTTVFSFVFFILRFGNIPNKKLKNQIYQQFSNKHIVPFFYANAKEKCIKIYFRCPQIERFMCHLKQIFTIQC